MVAEHQFLPGHGGLSVALEPTVVLHPLGQRVANEDDMVALVQLQRLAGSSRTQAKRKRQAKLPYLFESVLSVHNSKVFLFCFPLSEVICPPLRRLGQTLRELKQFKWAGSFTSDRSRSKPGKKPFSASGPA